MDETNTSSTGPASTAVAEAARREALARVATAGPHWVDLVVHATRERTLPPTATTTDEPLGERLDHGAPLTPLADPDTGGDALGAWGVGPSTVGDLLEARDTDGRRVAGELELQCALEAARLAPKLADDLARADPGLADRLAREHAPGLVDGGSVAPAAVLCAQVAAVLAVELVAQVREQLAPVPISHSAGGT
jgi:hypothetical protein